MEVVKAKWFNDADSPVVLMVDDLANLWVDLDGNGQLELGEDWGYWQDVPNSSFAFLRENLLDKFPEIRVTFFTIVAAPIICEHKYGRVYRGRIDENNKVAEFFRQVHCSPNLEIAYHGLKHGVIGNGKYVHEWCSFSSVGEALKNIEEGQKICEEIFGERLRGGKYPGYAKNAYSDESIDKAGFLWWCRDWTYHKFVTAGNDYSTLEVKTFGESNVVDFPSTVSPSILRNPIMKMERFILRTPYQSHRSLKTYLEGLLRNKNIISIQEHAGAIRGDGKRQTPNIIDTMPVLQRIFSFLTEKNVWHATCSEIADYYIAFTFTHLSEVEEDGFNLSYVGRVEKPWLTLLFDREGPVEITSPSGKSYGSVKHPHRGKCNLVNIEVENGYYRVREI